MHCVICTVYLIHRACGYFLTRSRNMYCWDAFKETMQIIFFGMQITLWSEMHSPPLSNRCWLSQFPLWGHLCWRNKNSMMYFLSNLMSQIICTIPHDCILIDACTCVNEYAYKFWKLPRSVNKRLSSNHASVPKLEVSDSKPQCMAREFSWISHSEFFRTEALIVFDSIKILNIQRFWAYLRLFSHVSWQTSPQSLDFQLIYSIFSVFVSENIFSPPTGLLFMQPCPFTDLFMHSCR